jgi:hypothetical protein
MHDHFKYVPVLRWKQGEKYALRDLFKEDRRHIYPLIELIPPNFSEQNAKKYGGDNGIIMHIKHEIEDYWGISAFFLDTVHIPKKLQMAVLASYLIKEKITNLIPVIYLESPSELLVLFKNNINSICIRIKYFDLFEKLNNKIDRILKIVQMTPQKVNLLIDLEQVENYSEKFPQILNNLNNYEEWRSIILISGALPKDLTNFHIGQHSLKRQDWILWKKFVKDINFKNMIPKFGDYTVQYPLYHEAPKNANVSASIRYTCEENWVIMRGEGLRNEGGPGFGQYPANAQLLCERNEFCGRNYSAGDYYIEEKAINPFKTGNPRTWIQAGINHHMTYVVRQLSDFF